MFTNSPICGALEKATDRKASVEGRVARRVQDLGFDKIGSNKTQKVDTTMTRVISASNQVLQALHLPYSWDETLAIAIGLELK